MCGLFQFALVSNGVYGPTARIIWNVNGWEVFVQWPSPALPVVAAGVLCFAIHSAAALEVVSGPFLIHSLIAFALPARPAIGGWGIIVRQTRLFGIYLAIIVAIQTTYVLLCMPLCIQESRRLHMDTNPHGYASEGEEVFVVTPTSSGPALRCGFEWTNTFSPQDRRTDL